MLAEASEKRRSVRKSVSAPRKKATRRTAAIAGVGFSSVIEELEAALHQDLLAVAEAFYRAQPAVRRSPTTRPSKARRRTPVRLAATSHSNVSE
ncbi:MAG: hypothetical protein U1E56_02695 [Bauldia sp.]